jgi:hypothetical protein
MFWTDAPSVEVAALQGSGRGYAVLANHSSQPFDGFIHARQPVQSLRQLTANGPHPIDAGESGWNMTIEAYDGAIVEWEA